MESYLAVSIWAKVSAWSSLSFPNICVFVIPLKWDLFSLNPEYVVRDLEVKQMQMDKMLLFQQWAGFCTQWVQGDDLRVLCGPSVHLQLQTALW